MNFRFAILDFGSPTQPQSKIGNLKSKIRSATHRWDVSVEEAKAIQQRLRDQVITRSAFGDLRTIAGVDVGFEGDVTRSVVVALSFPDLVPLDCAVGRRPVTFPYIPGLLAFREIPGVLAALEALKVEPDLFIVDGQALAHPRRLGIASHLGVLLDKPTIGCAKSRLVGEHVVPPAEPGRWVDLTDGQEVIGAVLRTTAECKSIELCSAGACPLQRDGRGTRPRATVNTA